MKEFTETDRHFISLLQDTINRMANNSANCKNWLLVITSASMAIVATNAEMANLLLILLFVIILFYCLDSYYLKLENNFRDVEKEFVKAHNNENISRLKVDVLLYNFNFKRLQNGEVDKKNRKKALLSPSTWPFYLTILLLMLIMYFCIYENDLCVELREGLCSINDCCPCCDCCNK